MKLIKIFFIFLTGCQTSGYFITDSPLQVPEIRKAATAIIGKPKIVSLNGRELISEYHDDKLLPLNELSKNKDRYQTKVVILGARRPYDINILVSLEQFENQTSAYVVRGIDENLSRQRAVLIKKALNLSLDKKSGFDFQIVLS